MGRTIRSDERVAEGTKLVIQCQEGYLLLNDSTTLECQSSGDWSREFNDCIKPESGIQNYEQFSYKGKTTEISYFPWHVGIYRWSQELSVFEYRCGGSIISPQVFVSAAHCFFNRSALNVNNELSHPDLFTIAGGKTYRLLDDERDSAFIQRRSVVKILTHPT